MFALTDLLSVQIPTWPGLLTMISSTFTHLSGMVYRVAVSSVCRASFLGSLVLLLYLVKLCF